MPDATGDLIAASSEFGLYLSVTPSLEFVETRTAQPLEADSKPIRFEKLSFELLILAQSA